MRFRISASCCCRFGTLRLTWLARLVASRDATLSGRPSSVISGPGALTELSKSVGMAPTGRLVVVALVLSLVAAAAGGRFASAASNEKIRQWGSHTSPRLRHLLPSPRSLLGPSLVGGVRSLLPPVFNESEGIPNRQVIHVPFSDVDRDGIRDVMEVDLDLRDAHPTYGFEGTMRVNTPDGASGGVLGNYELPFHSGVPFVVRARIGEDAVPGVFIFLTRFISTTEAPTSDFEVRAVTGTGREVWKRRWVSTSTSTASRYVAATNLAVPMDLLDRRAGPTDVLLGVYDYVGAVLSMTPVLISGEDGSTRSLDPTIVPWIEGTPWPVAAPDLDGDQVDDILTLETSGLGSGIMAASSGSGRTLWHNDSAATGRGTMVAEVGDVSRDGTSDFVLGGPLRLFDGADGEVVWERQGGSYVVSHGDVDRDGQRDVLSGRAFFAPHRFGARFSVVNSRGQRLAMKTYEAPRSEHGITWLITEEPGDIDGDRLPDSFVHLLHYGSERRVEQRFAISARSARPLARGSDLFALAGSLGGGTATELLRARRVGGSYRLTAVDGTSGKSLWYRRVRVPKTMHVAFHPWAAGGNERQADVAVSFFNPRAGRGLLIDGQDGQVLWTRRLRPQD
jgi:hypothetical protein